MIPLNKLSRAPRKQVAIGSKIDNFKFSADSITLKSNSVPLSYSLLRAMAKRSLFDSQAVRRLAKL